MEREVGEDKMAGERRVEEIRKKIEEQMGDDKREGVIKKI